ncbi:MAG: hypothetical protein R3C56_33685 [Pirellulaceae bacterium]
MTRGTLAEIAGQSFGNLNVMVLVRHPNVPDRPASMTGKRLFGNPDECFLQSRPKRGLLTQSEVRVIALAEMDLGSSSVVWDVGAGSGSVAIESAQLAPSGQFTPSKWTPRTTIFWLKTRRLLGPRISLPCSVKHRRPGLICRSPMPCSSEVRDVRWCGLSSRLGSDYAAEDGWS